MTKEELQSYITSKGFQNVELVDGDILDTLDVYVKNNPHLRIAFLHIDTDVYSPAKVGLSKLFNRVVRGGIIVFDDYACVEGETVAADEFLANHTQYTLQKFGFSHAKPSFIVKQ